MSLRCSSLERSLHGLSRLSQQQYRNRQQIHCRFALSQLLYKHHETSITRQSLQHYHSSSVSKIKTALDSCGLPSHLRSLTCSRYSLNKSSSSFTLETRLTLATVTGVRNMSSKHLATGSTCPPLQDGKIRLYSMRYCPYAQRALLAAEAKEIPHNIVNCNLIDKPEWLLVKNPEGKVPVLETNDGVILYESLIVAEYLDETYPKRPLYPKDPYKKALDKILIEKFGTATTWFFKLLMAVKKGEPETEKKERIQSFVQSLKPFEAELAKRGTPFFGGDQPGMLDYMIWPWFERIPFIKTKLPDLFDYDAAKQENPNLENWRQAMKKDKVVAKFLLSPEEHLRYLESMLTGSPIYD